MKTNKEITDYISSFYIDIKEDICTETYDDLFDMPVTIEPDIETTEHFYYYDTIGIVEITYYNTPHSLNEWYEKGLRYLLNDIKDIEYYDIHGRIILDEAFEKYLFDVETGGKIDNILYGQGEHHGGTITDQFKTYLNKHNREKKLRRINNEN